LANEVRQLGAHQFLEPWDGLGGYRVVQKVVAWRIEFADSQNVDKPDKVANHLLGLVGLSPA
jgi:hypothetical protein